MYTSPTTMKNAISVDIDKKNNDEFVCYITILTSNDINHRQWSPNDLFSNILDIILVTSWR